MDFETVKEQFEAMVTKMRAELEKYAKRTDAQHGVIEYRIDQIDKLINFYNSFETVVSELEMSLIEAHYNYNRLHSDTEKLVMFCQLHNVNPDMIFYYTTEQLGQMIKNGGRFIPPLRKFDDLKTAEDLKGEIYDMDKVDHKLADQYHTIAMRATLSHHQNIKKA